MDASFRGAQRVLSAALPECSHADGNSTLDGPMALERPRTVQSSIIEEGPLARKVPGEPEIAFHAFLDGIQRTRVLGYYEGIPLIYGTIAAVVRARIDRKLVTWRSPLIERRLYIPERAFPKKAINSLKKHFEITDTAADIDGPISRHPIALMENAVPMVQTDRSRLEKQLADAWCTERSEALLIDGGISGSERAARSACVVGAIKTHRTLYLDGKPLAALFKLRAGERSPAFRITSTRSPVVSWYLRLRDADGHDPMWGLVRVEISESGDVTARADEASRWLLAERTPLALPDGRWDRMTYGVRGCEEYLRAIL